MYVMTSGKTASKRHWFYDLIFVEHLSTIRVRSPHCTGLSPSKSDPCLARRRPNSGYQRNSMAVQPLLTFMPMMHVDPIPSLISTNDMVTLHSGLDATSILTLSPSPSPYQFLHTGILFTEILMMFFFEKMIYIPSYM